MGNKIKRKLGVVAKQDFLELGVNAGALFADLIKNGYIDTSGVVQPKFKKISDYSYLVSAPVYDSKKKEIYAILQKCQQKSVWREWGEAFVVALSLAVFVRTFFFQIYRIPTSSMVPTLMPGDKIFANRITYGPKIPFTPLHLPAFKNHERLDVVVFVPPDEKIRPWLGRKQFIKRLIGLPGDRVLIKGGSIYINGEKIANSRIDWIKYSNAGEYGKGNEEITVPEGKYFFLGDNPNNSQDSRYWGYADRSDIMGKAIFIWWPPKRITVIK